MRAAAFFDLDRTLLGGSSGLLLADALLEAGLLSARDATLAKLTGRAYHAMGETWLGMQITRRTISRIEGWPVEQLRAAARKALDVMDEAVYREARDLIERHRSEGRLVVIATSTGRDIVEPLAERLGVDHLIATDYEREDGRLTGRLIGAWLWGRDKAEAVKDFAAEHGVDMDESYAYSDSYYDRPLLEAVGFPRPVNPDPLLLALAARKGWPVLRFTGAVAPKSGLEFYDLLRPIAHPWLSPFKLRLEGVEHIPRSGGAILAYNHRSYADPLIAASVASRAGRKLRFLGKKEVFDAPVLGQLARATHQIRVDRGTGAASPLDEALDALRHGESIGIFPQGTIPRGEAFFDPVLRGKTGVARLSRASGLPVVPVALWDTEKLWPRSSRLPKLSIGRRAVYAKAGAPVVLDTDDFEAGVQKVMNAIADLLPDDVRYPPAPTEEALKATIPANVRTD